MLLFKQPVQEVAEGIRRAILRLTVRDNLLGVLPLIEQHFRDEAPSFVQDVARRFYPVGRDLLVPFSPPLVYGVGGQLKFPWFSFWRTNPLAKQRLSLFVTLVDEVLSQDPDLEAAKFEILDFSVPRGEKTRVLTVINAAVVPRIDKAVVGAMLEIFAEGFFRARDELAGKPARPRSDRKDDRPPPPRPPDLFDS